MIEGIKNRDISRPVPIFYFGRPQRSRRPLRSYLSSGGFPLFDLVWEPTVSLIFTSKSNGLDTHLFLILAFFFDGLNLTLSTSSEDAPANEETRDSKKY
jgi:hypothetical protein